MTGSNWTSKVRSEPLAPGDVLSAVEKLGLNIVRHDGDEIVCHCPAHEARVGKPDRNPSFSVNSTSGLFSCFSCDYRGAFATLAADMLNVDYEAAVEWVRSQGTIGVAHRILDRKSGATLSDQETVAPISRAALALFTDPPADELTARDLYSEEAQAYRIMWNPDSRAWIFPLYDLDTGRLLGWQEKRRRRVRNYPKDQVKTSLSLFGSHLPETEVAVVVESPLDAARIFGLGLTAYALFGSNPSQTQVNALMNRCERLIVCTDNDRAGRKAARRLVEGLFCTGVRTAVVTYEGLDDGVDPGDLPRSELVRQIDRADSAIWWRAC